MGKIEIWGQVVPNLLALAGRAIKEVAEHIPLSGFKLSDGVVFGLSTVRAEALSASLADSVVIGAVVKESEDLQSNLADSVVFGVTRFKSEDLQGPLAESVIITNV